MNCKLCNTEIPMGPHQALEHAASDCRFSNMSLYPDAWKAVFTAITAAEAAAFETAREMAIECATSDDYEADIDNLIRAMPNPYAGQAVEIGDGEGEAE